MKYINSYHKITVQFYYETMSTFTQINSLQPSTSDAQSEACGAIIKVNKDNVAIVNINIFYK